MASNDSNSSKTKKKTTPARKKPAAKVVRNRKKKTVWDTILTVLKIKRRKKKRIRNAKKRSLAQKSRGFMRRFFSWLFTWRIMGAFASIGMTLTIFAFCVLIFFSYDLPNLSSLNMARQSPGIVLKDKQGHIIGRFGNIHGDYLEFAQLPQDLVNAVLATEDRNFFKHFGLDPIGILRAMVVNVQRGGFVQGGSTITQQLAKNIFLTPDRTLRRKVQEMLLAFWMESRWEKEQIISIYLNRVYMGAGNYGIDAAAQYYFNKHAGELTLAESALIAGLLKAPSRYAPTNNQELAFGRAKQVLINMNDAGLLAEEEIEQAMSTLKLDVKKEEIATSSRYFADWVVDQLPDYIGTIEEDIIIETTLDSRLQGLANKSVQRHLPEETQLARKVDQAALVSMKPDGAVVAMIGGLDYKKSQFNRATQAKRQPGSAFKMVVYLAAVEMGYDPRSYFEDKPLRFRGWRPKNYDGRFRGHMTMHDALRNSINTIAVELGQLAGINNVINTAKRLGIKTPLSNIVSLPLGSSEVTVIEMATAFAHLSSNGKAVTPFGVREIRSRLTGDVLYKYEKPTETEVIKEDDVAMMNSMLSSVITHGTGKAAKIAVSAAGKTGTTSDYRDAWFVGYTSEFSTSVWVGNDNSAKMARISGGSTPARIWRSYMAPAHHGLKNKKLPMSSGSSSDAYSPNLPWLQKTTPSAKGTSTPAGPAAGGQKNGADLDSGFWNTLFSGDKKGAKNPVLKPNNLPAPKSKAPNKPQAPSAAPKKPAKIEYDYPSSRKRGIGNR